MLQEDYIRRVGGTTDIPIDVRIIGTVNEFPEKLIDEGKLRKDLYYRLNVVSIAIPPLRSRLDDIPLLTEKLLEKNTMNGLEKKFGWCLRERWTGSASMITLEMSGELENVIMQSVAMADTEHVLTEKLLQMPMQVKAIGADVEKWDRKGPLDQYLANLEKRKSFVKS